MFFAFGFFFFSWYACISTQQSGIFAAGFATFSMIYCVQPLMPALNRDIRPCWEAQEAFLCCLGLEWRGRTVGCFSRIGPAHCLGIACIDSAAFEGPNQVEPNSSLEERRGGVLAEQRLKGILQHQPIINESTLITSIGITVIDSQPIAQRESLPESARGVRQIQIVGIHIG